MVKFKEQIKCPSHEQNLEKQRRHMQVSTGVCRPNMSKALSHGHRYTQLLCLSLLNPLFLSIILYSERAVKSVHLAELVAHQELLSMGG